MSEELREDPLHESTKTENKHKNEEREEVQRDISHELPDGLQEFREKLMKVPQQSFGETPRAWKSRHFQVISRTSNGAASKSGTEFGQTQCIYALSEGPIVISVGRRKYQGLLAEDVLVQSYPERNISVT